MEKSLIITGIGVLLIFIAIFLLWGMMELLVRLTQGKKVKTEAAVEPAAPVVEAAPEPPAAALPTGAEHLKIQAAAAAVAAVLAQNKAKSGKGFRPPTYAVSTWQTVMRAGQMNKRSDLFTRKPRG
jgi:Na+-transporting methylmalonyl-CoA/oxaloacetate decarboxylase gamma subunit